MLRTGEQYVEALRDGRQVHLGSEVVTDVTAHPAFRNAVRSVARLYDAARADADRYGHRDEDDGAVHNAIWLRPRTQADLLARRRAHDGWADLTYGLIGRSPDHVAGYLTGMACHPAVADAHGQGFGAHIVDYWRFARDNDLYVSYAVAPPGRARGPEVLRTPSGSAPASDPARTSALRVVAEDDAGITVWGTKILATAGALADELLIGNLLPLSPGEESFAVTFATPVAAPGVKLISRKSFEHGAHPLDDPLAARFDESDVVVFCDNVFVPWERVFAHGHLDTALALFNHTPAHVLGNAQAQSRLLAKMRLTLGVITRVSELTGTARIPAVREMLATRATEVAVVDGLIAASDAHPDDWPEGHVSPNLQTLYATTAWSTENVPVFMHGVRELLGSQPFQVAADAGVFDDPETAGVLVSALGSESVAEAQDRYRLMKLAWDLVGSEFASRHLQYEMFYAGAKHVTRARVGHNFRWDVVAAAADRCLSDLQGVAALDGVAAPATARP
ncbi:MAG: 4-hydroxyphenylacetate 3-monooxygenase [Solirubrobacteraceae bacterium]|jgi:4-hydroxyphenylacetate 3-monooxygenase|nr:4-hydroxyphenylacetate 3-monooxygenase [Solirubrobacteraceae bacterium]